MKENNCDHKHFSPICNSCSTDMVKKARREWLEEEIERLERLGVEVGEAGKYFHVSTRGRFYDRGFRVCLKLIIDSYQEELKANK